MQDRIAAARRNLATAESQGDWGQAAASRAEIVRLAVDQESAAAPVDEVTAGDEPTTTRPTRPKRTAKEN